MTTKEQVALDAIRYVLTRYVGAGKPTELGAFSESLSRLVKAYAALTDQTASTEARYGVVTHLAALIEGRPVAEQPTEQVDCSHHP